MVQLEEKVEVAPEIVLLITNAPPRVPVQVIKESSVAAEAWSVVVAPAAENVPPDIVKFFPTNMEDVATVDEGALKYPPDNVKLPLFIVKSLLPPAQVPDAISKPPVPTVTAFAPWEIVPLVMVRLLFTVRASPIVIVAEVAITVRL